MSITHETRRESNEQLDRETLNQHIISTLKEGKALTAREIAVIMYNKKYIPYPVRQAVAPRLTELEAEDVVEVIDKVYDQVTKRMVAVYRLVAWHE